MPRHSKEERVVEQHVDKKRKDVLDKFFGLTSKALKHIEWSLESTVICTACSVGMEGKHVAGKAKNAEGNCKFCEARGHVPDKQQRNWAVGEIADRIAPKPRPTEMTIETVSGVEDFEKELKGKSLSDLKRFVGVDGLEIISPDKAVGE